MSNISLTVTPRTVIGKANRRLAAYGAIPGIVYGAGRPSLPVAVSRHDFEILMAHHAAGATVLELQVEGEKKPIHAMIREVQTSAVKGGIRHVDFLAVAMNKPVHAVVTLHFVNDAAGVKAGGVLTIDRHDINVEAKPGDLPEVIDIDVAKLGIGDTLHVSDVVAPAGVTLLDDPDDLLASVTPPTVEVTGAAEIVEPEVIGEKAQGE